ncbi:hypothetical protein HNQ91_002847 [Filimonas zeae]|nr:hypothetical protein [Filimonas zeae]MDR6339782.1 hypothetical protein [Filimonas zeae]
MQKIILLLLLLYGNTLCAQYFGFGFRGGANISRFTDGVNGYQSNLGNHYGTMTYFGINRHLGIQLDILYSK